MFAYHLPDSTLPEMAPESRPRVTLSYWKNVFGLTGVLIGSLAAAPLFEKPWTPWRWALWSVWWG
jgi:hypothetical protein